jgi:imidazolonepropionase-like amidohydrolase
VGGSLGSARNLPFLAGTAAAYGLDKEEALQLITANNAEILGIAEEAGTLEAGKRAILFVSEGDALDMRSNRVEMAFIDGRKVTLPALQQRLYEKYKTKYQTN